MSMNPFVTVTCPSCFEEIYLGECRIMSGTTRGKVLKVAKKGPLARMRVEPLSDPKYRIEMAYRECTACQYPLPFNIEQVQSIRLAIVGGTAYGKSHYIAALIHQMKSEWITEMSGMAQFIGLTPDVDEEYIQNYFHPLFRLQSVLAATQLATRPTAYPLIYNVTLAPSSKHPRRSFNLMIYDAAGEDLVSLDRLVNFARFALNPTAFVFVVDPLTIAPIFSQLPPQLQASAYRPYYDHEYGAADFIRSLASLYERLHYPSGSRLLDVPAAVMLSKSDLLKYLHLPPNRFLMKPSYGDKVDLLDLDTVDQEVRSLLAANQQNDLLAAASRFKRVKFFASSATGEPPDANGRYYNVNPCRCLDPLLWILYELGIVEAIE